jgi:Domain of unknown function (DUF4111)/Nucleotidyltransferase domain
MVVLPEPAETVVARFLARLDRALPGVVTGFYVVGSIALGGFRPGRSDIDFVAVIDRPLTVRELTSLRRVHRRSCADGAIALIIRPPRSWPLVCNGVFLRRADLAAPPQAASVVASQSGERFRVGRGFDVNPVTWWTLAHAGITVRGNPARTLPLHVDEAALRAWTAANLTAYWRPWADAMASDGPAAARIRLRSLGVRRMAASGVLSAARMHATIRTGSVITKDQAGEYALGEFGSPWHPVIRDALAYWRGQPAVPGRPARVLRTNTAAFVTHVADVAGTPSPDKERG